jgi:hypothetical protein
VDLPKGESPSFSEIRPVSPHDGNLVAGIKVEELTDIKEEDLASITSTGMTTEHGVSCM